MNGNKIKRKIRNIKYRGKGQGREGTRRVNAFSYGLRTIIMELLKEKIDMSMKLLELYCFKCTCLSIFWPMLFPQLAS